MVQVVNCFYLPGCIVGGLLMDWYDMHRIEDQFEKVLTPMLGSAASKP